MKTPIQEFYEYMEQNQYFIGNDLYKKYHEMLEKEKKMVIDAFINGDNSDCLQEQDSKLFAEQYFNEIFNTEEK